MKKLSLPVRIVVLVLILLVIANGISFLLDVVISHGVFTFRALSGGLVPVILGVFCAFLYEKDEE